MPDKGKSKSGTKKAPKGKTPAPAPKAK